ncbi:MAG: CRTAC1 family protein [Planctomycetes bacterium]|nr:CRTAC1 family protein [Planctomycetota bacterium]
MSRVKLLLAMLWVAIVVAGCGAPEPSRNAPVEQKLGTESASPALLFPTVKPSGDSSESSVPGTLAFVDVARERGLTYEWPMKPRPMTALDAFGAGCAAFDADNDGWQDILLVASPTPLLFRNEEGLRFTNLTDESGLKSISGHWTGCAVGDYDADGLLDLFITGYHQLRLMKNVDGRHFRDVTVSAGLDPSNQGYWGASAGFMDLDGDGWIDLVILNYVVYGPDSQKYCEYAPGVISGCGPRTYPPERGQIWRNKGGTGFELVPESQGMQQTHGVGLVLAFTDLDDDGRQDFYIGNDGVTADLMFNRGNFEFENIAVLAGVATSDDGGAVSAMGADWGDYNRDGRLDLAVTNWQGDSFVLFQNLGNRLFVDCARSTDLARATRNHLGFGSKWIDFENDGWPDLFFVNGHVYDNSAEIHGSSVPFRQPMCLFWNDRGRKFFDIVPRLGTDVQRTMVGRGSVTIDFNNDGRVDLLAVDYEGPTVLLENRTDTSNHWLTIDLRGKAPNTFAYGTRLTGKAGDRIWVAEVSPASSYLSSSDPRIHWGLAELKSLESLTIRWPTGASQTLNNIPADRVLRVVEGQP